MILFLTGNLLESKANALVNTVNLEGVMGKGIALQFRDQFPLNTKLYIQACKDKKIGIGKLLVVKDATLFGGEKTIINFPTKTTWRQPSEYRYIEEGLINLVEIIKSQNIKSIAIPALGAGNGGLDWLKVKALIEKYLSDVNSDIHIYEPILALDHVNNNSN